MMADKKLVDKHGRYISPVKFKYKDDPEVQLNKAAAGGETSGALPGRAPCNRIEHDVDANALGGFQDLVSQVRRL